MSSRCSSDSKDFVAIRLPRVGVALSDGQTPVVKQVKEPMKSDHMVFYVLETRFPNMQQEVESGKMLLGSQHGQALVYVHSYQDVEAINDVIHECNLDVVLDGMDPDQMGKNHPYSDDMAKSAFIFYTPAVTEVKQSVNALVKRRSGV